MSHRDLPTRAQVIVVGSGAGGAVTAATLAEHGYDVLILEEGPRYDTSTLSTNSPEAIARLYRGGGMTPILGSQTIAFVEGCCVGGSTEINSAFWHRLPPECYGRWQTEALLEDFTPESMESHFEFLEAALSVSHLPPDDVPQSSRLFRTGIERLGWSYLEVPRAQARSRRSAFDPGAKQSMQRTFIPRALAAGATLVSECKALSVRHHRGRADAVVVVHDANGSRTRREIRADTIVLAGGPIQTAALLRRSGIKRNVGNNLRIHPMIKAAAVFDEEVEAHEAALPVYQVKEFWPTMTLGGSVFTPGFLAMLLAENWTMYQRAMPSWRSAALYYAATRSMARGTIRVVPGLEDGVIVRYPLSKADERNLSVGLGRLGEVLFAAGARAVFPSARGQPILKSAEQCRGLLAHPLPIADMGLSTVHAFSSCPMGENPDLCATDSFGKVNGFTNLYVNDASLLPDSPGVNPQGATMAVARRNAERFIACDRRRQPRAASGRPPVLVTGATGWLGSRLVERLVAEGESVRCLVLDGETPAADRVEVIVGDLADIAAARALCHGAEGATLFHTAGVIHPAWGTREFERVNVEGTRTLVNAAAEAGVRRVVAMSSNSPAGVSFDPDVVFDETSPDHPYMGYGRSKARMEAVLRAGAATGRPEAVLLRAPWFYGPHQPPRQTRFFRMIKEGRFPILGSGTQRRSLAYVDDICAALLLAAQAPGANGQIYWIADERPYTILEIVETVEQVLEEDFGLRCRHRQLRLPAAAGDAARLCDRLLQAVGLYSQSLHVLGELGSTIACSIAKAKAELGYAPVSSLRAGMAESVAWCLAQGERI